MKTETYEIKAGEALVKSWMKTIKDLNIDYKYLGKKGHLTIFEITFPLGQYQHILNTQYQNYLNED